MRKLYITKEDTLSPKIEAKHNLVTNIIQHNYNTIRYQFIFGHKRTIEFRMIDAERKERSHNA